RLRSASAAAVTCCSDSEQLGASCGLSTFASYSAPEGDVSGATLVGYPKTAVPIRPRIPISPAQIPVLPPPTQSSASATIQRSGRSKTAANRRSRSYGQGSERYTRLTRCLLRPNDALTDGVLAR